MQAPEGDCSRRQRNKGLIWAWATLVPSKASTLLLQIIAIPLVYNSIGPSQFAAYASVTACVSIFGILNVGMGGALVTRLADAAAQHDKEREASLLAAAVVPLVALSLLTLVIALPVLWSAPLDTLFGLAATTTTPQALRSAVLLACIGTVGIVPLSAVDSARQAYQEMHITNLFGALTNVCLCGGLLLVAWLAPKLPLFVAVTALVPLALRFLNSAFMFSRRPYLLRALGGTVSWQTARSMAGDGLCYAGAAAIASVLVYQWPVYYISRIRSPLESASFAVYMQFIVLMSSLGASLALPLWAAVADATARLDNIWLTRMVRRTRVAALVWGVSAAILLACGMNLLMTLWLRQDMQFPQSATLLAGTYILLAAWEYAHWSIALGLGSMRLAAGAALLRAVLGAVAIPFGVANGVSGAAAALCLSLAFTTAWYYPLLVNKSLRASSRKFMIA